MFDFFKKLYIRKIDCWYDKIYIVNDYSFIYISKSDIKKIEYDKIEKKVVLNGAFKYYLKIMFIFHYDMFYSWRSLIIKQDSVIIYKYLLNSFKNLPIPWQFEKGIETKASDLVDDLAHLIEISIKIRISIVTRPAGTNMRTVAYNYEKKKQKVLRSLYKENKISYVKKDENLLKSAYFHTEINILFNYFTPDLIAYNSIFFTYEDFLQRDLDTFIEYELIKLGLKIKKEDLLIQDMKLSEKYLEVQLYEHLRDEKGVLSFKKKCFLNTGEINYIYFKTALSTLDKEPKVIKNFNFPKIPSSGYNKYSDYERRPDMTNFKNIKDDKDNNYKKVLIKDIIVYHEKKI